MQWSDEGIVIATRRHGETALIVELLTRTQGRHAGLVRGGQGRRGGTVYQIGNEVLATWTARLADHLGHYACELVRGNAAAIIDDPLRLACLSAFAAVASSSLPEREPQPKVYEDSQALVRRLCAGADWPQAYVRWELTLLAELGFGLDLERCAVTGTAEDLAFVSPRTGRAVARAAAVPYAGRLLPLPAFLLGRGEARADDVVNGLALTGHFLAREVFGPQSKPLPAARARFAEAVSKATKQPG